jgi:hypothetical protein
MPTIKISHQKKWKVGDAHYFYKSKQLDRKGKFNFLDNLFRNFVKRTGAYMHTIKYDAPYLYGERELNSVILTSIAQYTDACLAELPTRRITQGKRYVEASDNHGRTDFWARYMGQDFFIETKHSYCARNRKTINIDTLQKWEEVISQLKKSKKTNEQYADKKVVNHLAIVAIVLKTKNKVSEKDFEESDWADLQKNYLQLNTSELEPSIKSPTNPDWIGILKISSVWIKKTQKKFDSGDTYQYQGVIFLAKYI